LIVFVAVLYSHFPFAPYRTCRVPVKLHVLHSLAQRVQAELEAAVGANAPWASPPAVDISMPAPPPPPQAATSMEARMDDIAGIGARRKYEYGLCMTTSL